jgi:hypothetical protein
MTNQITLVVDIALDIEKVLSYSFEESTTKSALIQSGIVERNAMFDDLVASSGSLINMPYWTDLPQGSQVLPNDGTSTLLTRKIQSGLDKATVNHRGDAFAVNDLVAQLALTMKNDPNADPMKVIAQRLSSYWIQEYQLTMLSILEGIFGAASMAGNSHDITSGSGAAARTINGSTLIDAEGKLGDAGSKLTGLMVHSATERKMRKDDLIDYIPDSEGKPVIAMYQGKRVIVDDSCPVSTGDYTSYLFGQGAFANGEDTNPTYPLLETDRVKLAGTDVLITRRKFMLHPRGVAFQDVANAGDSPTNAEYEDQRNWVAAYDLKNIRIVEFKHKLA